MSQDAIPEDDVNVEDMEISLDEAEVEFVDDDDESDDTYEGFAYDEDDETFIEPDGEPELEEEDDEEEEEEEEEEEDEEEEDLEDFEDDIDEEAEVEPLDGEFAPVRGRKKAAPVPVLIADNEFTCTECFLVKKPSQLADRANKICVDCY